MKLRRVEYDPVALAYSGEQQFGGANLPYFQGGRQYGAGWLRTVARMFFPIAKRAFGVVGNVAANTAQDLIDDRKGFKQSIKDNAISEATRLVGNIANNAAVAAQKRRAASINKRRAAAAAAVVARKRKHNHRTIFDRH